VSEGSTELLRDFSEADAWLARIAPPVDFCSLRLVESRTQAVATRRGVPLPSRIDIGCGAMVTVIDGGGVGYAATSDLSFPSLYQAARTALTWAERMRERAVIDFSSVDRPRRGGSYATTEEIPWEAWPLSEKLERLLETDALLGADPRVVDRRTRWEHRRTVTRLVTTDGISIDQTRVRVVPDMVVVASDHGETQQRSFGGRGSCRQGGLEMIEALGWSEAGERLRDEAVALLDAPLCPSGPTRLLIGPSQMILQIHESIGHPLELDRILGDERNFAGTSFVGPGDFGTLQYGSDLLNVSFDPTLPEEFASYGFDDEGAPAERRLLIERGILRRGLGGGTSAARLARGGEGLPPAEVEAVACSRACHWNRPPIDRMANLNVEPGEDSLTDLLARAEDGIFVDVNSSWSIDDSRRNFQFGCEVGRRIEGGELKGWVRNPGYRGRSTDFWRSLIGVGDRSTFEVLGTPNCGKGEPNQMVEVGHASPVCLFDGIDVFGTGV